MRHQSGVLLIEALIGMLIFSVGILALVGLQAVALKATDDARYRADASYLANALIGQMWADANATGAAATPSFAHRPNGNACASTGTASTNVKVGDATQGWLQQVATTLPMATPERQQIQVLTQVSPPPLAQTYYLVTVALCWVSPQDKLPHNHIAVAYVHP